MTNQYGKRPCLLILLFISCLPVLAFSSPASLTSPTFVNRHAVYFMTNDPLHNQIVSYARSYDGQLHYVNTIATLGRGSGGANFNPLHSQSSLILAKHAKYLLAVNAGSNEISVIDVHAQTMHVVSKVNTHGTFPISMTTLRNQVYILNRGDINTTSSITAFRMNHQGHLIYSPSNNRTLPPGEYTQIGVDHFGSGLFLTDAKNNTILFFSHTTHGSIAEQPIIFVTTMHGPTGFTFDPLGHLSIVENETNRVSTYQFKLLTKQITLISHSDSQHQLGPHWIAQTRGGFTYVSNSTSHTLSAYKVWAESGKAKIITAITGLGNYPTELAITRSNNYVYSLNPGDGSIHMYKVNRFKGDLSNIGVIKANLPLYAQGIAAN